MLHGPKVESKFPESATANVIEVEILQVISNLPVNATDAIPSENGRIFVRVKTTSNKVHGTNSDNGEGIPAHMTKRSPTEAHQLSQWTI